MEVAVWVSRWFLIYTCFIATVMSDVVHSFTLAQTSGSADQSAALDIGDCPADAREFLTNKTYVCSCGREISNREIWGTEVYTSSSDICTAAVHAGALTKGISGRVVLETMNSPPVFKGTTRNGITSHVLAHPYDNPIGPGAYRIRPVQ
ncbi:MAG: hypothetical protein JOY71_15130 [Acetobacteraceae bacterium]|nr:hypothetical protein [Acetobacteraceae bacterium]